MAFSKDTAIVNLYEEGHSKNKIAELLRAGYGHVSRVIQEWTVTGQIPAPLIMGRPERSRNLTWSSLKFQPFKMHVFRANIERMR
jgi:transposase